MQNGKTLSRARRRTQPAEETSPLCVLRASARNSRAESLRERVPKRDFGNEVKPIGSDSPPLPAATARQFKQVLPIIDFQEPQTKRFQFVQSGDTLNRRTHARIRGLAKTLASHEKNDFLQFL